MLVLSCKCAELVRPRGGRNDPGDRDIEGGEKVADEDRDHEHTGPRPEAFHVGPKQ
jgi:hypothetical protein